jgi:hypothetical protein
MVRHVHASRFFGGGHEDICCALLMSLGACLLHQNYFPPRFPHIVLPKHLRRLAGKYERFQHLRNLMAEIYDHESSLVSYIRWVAPVVKLLHPLAPEKYDKYTKWPIVQFKYIV